MGVKSTKCVFFFWLFVANRLVVVFVTIINTRWCCLSLLFLKLETQKLPISGFVTHSYVSISRSMEVCSQYHEKCLKKRHLYGRRYLDYNHPKRRIQFLRSILSDRIKFWQIARFSELLIWNYMHTSTVVWIEGLPLRNQCGAFYVRF